MRSALLLLVALALAPAVGAQNQLINPVEGAFTDVYVIAGRLVDPLGRPAPDADVVIDLDQEGVRMVPLRAKSDCYGTFITFFDLREVRRDGKAEIRVFDRDGNLTAEVNLALDPFFRRTDVNIKLDRPYLAGCPEATEAWPKRVSVTGRVVNRTEDYTANGVKHSSEPASSIVRLRFWDSPTHFFCPPSLQDPEGCDPNSGSLDERGDLRYSWVIDRPVNVTGTFVEVIVDGKSYNFTVDPAFRLATVHIEATGQGPPKETPGPTLSVLLVALAGAAFALRRR